MRRRPLSGSGGCAGSAPAAAAAASAACCGAAAPSPPGLPRAAAAACCSSATCGGSGGLALLPASVPMPSSSVPQSPPPLFVQLRCLRRLCWPPALLPGGGRLKTAPRIAVVRLPRSQYSTTSMWHVALSKVAGEGGAAVPLPLAAPSAPPPRPLVAQADRAAMSAARCCRGALLQRRGKAEADNQRAGRGAC